MPQLARHHHISLKLHTIMNQLILETRQPEPSTILVESTPVKESETIHSELIAKKSICARDVVGLSWIFAEDDYS